MGLRVIRMYHIPERNPRAGESFRLVVELNRNVGAGDGVVQVSFEKQRILPNNGGFPELRPTGATYFALDPTPITVGRGHNTGTSNPIKVRPDASVGGGDPPVVFPEELLFTAFIGTLNDGFHGHVVRVLEPQVAGPEEEIDR